MRTILNPISVFGFILFFLLAPVLPAGSGDDKAEIICCTDSPSTHTELAGSAKIESQAMGLYEQIGLKRFGLGKKAFAYAYKGYTYLLQHRWLSHNNILSICDFSQSSRRKRMYIVDLQQKKVLINTYVAHGRNSGSEYARSFSNNPESHKSSLGFYVTQHTYFGDHGLSLKIRGLERGFNDKAEGRNVVVHGSDYVGSDFLRWNRFNGRSFGCPAVPSYISDDVIRAIKDGSCLFIYHPTKQYIVKSKILNS